MNEEQPKPKPSKIERMKRYRTKSGNAEHVPGLGFTITDAILQRPFTIRAIENFEARTGKHVMGTVVVLD